MGPHRPEGWALQLIKSRACARDEDKQPRRYHESVPAKTAGHSDSHALTHGACEVLSSTARRVLGVPATVENGQVCLANHIGRENMMLSTDTAMSHLQVDSDNLILQRQAEEFKHQDLHTHTCASAFNMHIDHSLCNECKDKFE